MARFYAGIGSRETPKRVCAAMTEIARTLRQHDYVLRSGAARGADAAFEAGAGPDKLIYLPWVKFNDHSSPYYNVSPDALAIAASYHPAWKLMNEYGRRLHGRNSYQVLGLDLRTKADFVICWTPQGRGGGGTGQAIRIATAYGIPVFDLAAWNATALLDRVLTVAAAVQRQPTQQGSP